MGVGEVPVGLVSSGPAWGSGPETQCVAHSGHPGAGGGPGEGVTAQEPQGSSGGSWGGAEALPSPCPPTLRAAWSPQDSPGGSCLCPVPSPSTRIHTPTSEHCFPESSRNPGSGLGQCSPTTLQRELCPMPQGGWAGRGSSPLPFTRRPPPAPPGCRDPPRPLSEAICHQSRESPGRSHGDKLEMCRCSYQQKATSAHPAANNGRPFSLSPPPFSCRQQLPVLYFPTQLAPSSC